MPANNAFLDSTVYARTMLYLVVNDLVMGKCVEKKFVDQVTDENGLSINIKRPPRFVTTSGEAYQKQSTLIGSVNVKVSQYKGVHCGFGDLESVTSVNDLVMNAAMRSAASTLAQDIETHLAQRMAEFPSYVNAPSATDTVSRDIARVNDLTDPFVRLGELAVPTSDRKAVVSMRDAGNMLDKLMDHSILSGAAGDAMSRARLPTLLNMDTYYTQSNPVHTCGTRVASGAGAAIVNGANQSYDYVLVKDSMTGTLNVDGMTASTTVKAGDIFTIAGVYRVNQATGAVLAGQLMQFRVTEDATATAGGVLAIKYYPAIIVANTRGQGASADADIQRANTAFQTCSAVPADNVALTFVGAAGSSRVVRAAWHKSAIQLVTAPLRMPEEGKASVVTDPNTGISIRYWRGSDFLTGQHGHRWDMIYGSAVIEPLLGTQFAGRA